VNVRNAYLVSSLGHAGVLALGFALASLVRTPAIVPGVRIVLGGGSAAGGTKKEESITTSKPPAPVPKPEAEIETPRPRKKIEAKAPPERVTPRPAEARGARPARDAGIVSKAPSEAVVTAAASSSASRGSGSRAGLGPGRGGRGDVGVEAEGHGEAGPASGYLSLLRERVATAWEPPIAIDRAGEARVVVTFSVVASGGRPEEVSVQSSSGVSLFDRRAMAAVADAAPLPPIPAHLGFASIVIRFTFTQQY